MDNADSPEYHVHYIVTPKLIPCITDVTPFSPTHANSHITPKDD